jgi:hypothetical protein
MLQGLRRAYRTTITGSFVCVRTFCVFAPQQEGRHAPSAVRRHDDPVTLVAPGRREDCLPGRVAN